jgi:hypothetical protein
MHFSMVSFVFGVSRSVIQTPVSLDFRILAVVSPVKDFRLCWLLNRELHLDLTRRNDFTLPDRQGQFGLFTFADETDKVIYHLVANKSGAEVLVPELRANDFFLIIKGHCPEDRLEAIQEGLRATDGIQAVFRIKPENLASVHNLIMDDAEF